MFLVLSTTDIFYWLTTIKNKDIFIPHTTYIVLSFSPVNFYTYLLILLVTFMILNNACKYICLVSSVSGSVSCFLVYKKNIWAHLLFHLVVLFPTSPLSAAPLHCHYILYILVTFTLYCTPKFVLCYGVGITGTFRDQAGHTYESTGPRGIGGEHWGSSELETKCPN